MFKKIAASVAGGILLAGVGAMPAAALTEDGTVKCSGGAKRAVAGEQQRLYDTLTLHLAGTRVYRESNVYTGSYVAPSGGTSSWSANSVSLLLSGSGGFCQPL